VVLVRGTKTLEPCLDPGDERGISPGPGLGVILTRKEVRQFMTEGYELVPRGMEHDAAWFVEGLAQEKGGAVPIFLGVGQVGRVAAQVDRLLAKGPAETLRPDFQLRKGPHRPQPIIIAMAAVAPDLVVKDHLVMPIRL
jgi:hypothetical protein